MTTSDASLIANGHGHVIGSCGHTVKQCRCHASKLLRGYVDYPCSECGGEPFGISESKPGGEIHSTPAWERLASAWERPSMAKDPALKYSDPGTQFKGTTAEVGRNADPDRREIIPCFMSTDSVDADNEVLLPDGVDLSRYNKNKVVLLCHSYGQPGSFYPLPVGKVEWIQKRSRGLEAGVRFTVTTPMGREVKALFDDDMLRSFSVGFKPVKQSLMTYEEAQTRSDWKAAFERTNGRIMVHREWLLLELSVAPVPSNPDALVTTYAKKGMTLPGWLSLPKPKPKADAVKTPNTTRFDLGRKALDDGADGIAAVDVTPADARVMVALWVPPETASAIAIPGGEAPEDLHLTLCYLGRAIEIGTNAIDRLKQMCRDVAASTTPLLGKIGGMGRFSASDTSDGQDVIYASADLPGLAECRQQLANILGYSGIAYSKAHGFTPHITLAYVDPAAESPIARIEPTPVAFTHLCLSIEGEKTTFPFNTSIDFGPSYAYRNTQGTNKGGTVETVIKCAMGKALSLGDHVRDIGSGMCGEVKSLHTEGTHPFDSEGEDDAEIEASEDNPVAHVHQHDDDHERTKRVFAIHAKGLATIPDDDEGMEDGEKAIEPPETKVAKPPAEPDGDEMSPDAETEEVAEDMDEDDENTTAGGFRRGDHVKVKSPHYKGFGVVQRIFKRGHVADVPNDVMGTEDDPAARVKCYKAFGDGHMPTEDHIGVRCKHLTPMAEEMVPPTKMKAASAPATAKARTKGATAEPAIEPLPPLVAMSEQQVQAEILASVDRTEAKAAQAAREEVQRLFGVV